MTVGLALSSGGAPAFLASICTLEWLAGTFPNLLTGFSDVVLATASGGSLGNAVFANAEYRIGLPHWNEATTYEEALSDHYPGKVWFAVGASLPHIGFMGSHDHSASQAGHHGRRRTPNFLSAKAWEDITLVNARRYGIKHVAGGNLRWFDTFAFIPKKAAPLHVNKENYLSGSQSGSIGLGWREMSTGQVYPPNAAVDTVQAAAWSSAFWSCGPLVNGTTLGWMLEKHLMPQDNSYYFTDGGLFEGTGIVQLLREQVTSIVAFVNMPGGDVAGVFKIMRLFGFAGGQGNWGVTGPHRLQVFSSAYGDAVRANLTNTEVMRARLTNVPVMGNSFLGVKPYMLENLVIFTNLRSQEFMDSFRDPRIKHNLSPHFPVDYPSAFDLWPKLDTNSFCMLQQWKGERYKDEIREALGQ